MSNSIKERVNKIVEGDQWWVGCMFKAYLHVNGSIVTKRLSQDYEDLMWDIESDFVVDIHILRAPSLNAAKNIAIHHFIQIYDTLYDEP